MTIRSKLTLQFAGIFALILILFSLGIGIGDFVAFDDTEIYKFIGILFANGLMHRPMFETWFYSVRNRPMYADTFVTSVFDKIVHGRKISGRRQWQHLRRFLTLSNYRLNPAEEQQKNPMWKVQSLLDELNH